MLSILAWVLDRGWDVGQHSTTEIRELIERLKDVVSTMQTSRVRNAESVIHSTEASGALEEILVSMTLISDMNIQIASAAEEQSMLAEDISLNIEQIGQVASSVAEGAQETAQAGSRLSELTKKQRTVINIFKV
ncbi:Methyl-accepting chemotaxis protein CtpH [compost metagenome]